MYIRFFFFIFLSGLTSDFLIAQNHLTRFNDIDIIHYRFNLELKDDTDVLTGKAKVDIQFKKAINSFQLDLVGKHKDSKTGMTVSGVQTGKKDIRFEHAGAHLTIFLDETSKDGNIQAFTISYKGIPADGLIIGQNKHGDRTFFGDNWPDRAHHWLPCVDHPSDKATVEFIVTAPNHYQVIANGEQIEETNITDDTKLTHWKAKVPLPTKVMVIGAARFAVNLAGHVEGIPVTSWVYRQDRDNGFYDYKIAVEVLDFFVKNVGEYPYEKLANVQSKTRYGGMENAGNIFYFENSVNGKQDQEKLIAHEIAHQWFGNSASEFNWHHIWLSEGFATYFTDLYLEKVRGREAFVENLKSERERVLNYARKSSAPIIDVSISNYNKLLSPNAYQKGAWILHMLRKKVGDENFWKGIRAYYKKYKFSNALTEDFQKIMEETSGQNLNDFFQQWLYRPGHPVLKISTQIKKNGNYEININQQQKGTIFQFPIDIKIITEKGEPISKTIHIDSKSQTLDIETNSDIKEIIIDPDCWLLFEEQ